MPKKISDIGYINPRTRMEAENLVREFQGVVNQFSKVLQFKERERLILECKIKELDKHIEDNLSKLNVLKINLNIYEKNDEKISNGLVELERQEGVVNEKYESMLAGKISTDSMVSLERKELPVQKKVAFEVESKLMEKYSNGILGREDLIQRRRRYIEDLDNTFQKFDEELFNIDGVRNNLLNARAEITHKKDKALNSKTALEANYKDIKEEKLKFELELEHSIEEESYILNEFRELLYPISDNLEISPQTDQLLINLNSASESDREASLNSNEETGHQGHLKVLENPVRASGT